MSTGVPSLRVLLAALALAIAAGVGPTAAQSASGANPTAESVREDALLGELNKIQGRVTIPDAKLATLEQPQGRDYRAFHERALPWIGGVVILGMIAAIVAFYLYRGTITLPPDERPEVRILRFSAIERFTHWMTATSFLVLALTGLNYVFGKRLLMPLIGPDAFSAWSQAAKYLHNFLAFPFLLGVLLMIVMWLRPNLPDRYDLAWLKAAGGFVGTRQPNALRFNAGQKLVFWCVALGGLVLASSGIVMLFPFSMADVNGMQIAQYVHALGSVGLTAVIIAHIYIGTLGMEGAWDAMGSGTVGLGWARHHHRAWVEQQHAAAGPGAGRESAPPAPAA